MRSTIRHLGMSTLIAMVTFGLIGCGGPPTETKPTKVADDHPEEGPHGGALAELGTKHAYHAEIVIDDETKTATIYILDGKAKKEIEVVADQKPKLSVKHEEKTITIDLKPKGQETMTTAFVGTDDVLAEDIRIGDIQITGLMIKEKPHKGKFEDHREDDE